MHVLLLLCILLMIPTNVVPQVCNRNVTNRELQNRTYNGVPYKKGEYFVDDVTGSEYGCVCLKEICIIKCCAFGKGFDLDSSSCVSLTNMFNPRAYEGPLLKARELNAEERFIYAKTELKCSEGENLIQVGDVTEDYQLTSDGDLAVVVESEVPASTLYSTEKYCLDNFLINGNVKQDAIICATDKKTPSLTIYHLTLNASCMLVSCFFMILTIAVYIILPDLRNSIPGMIMIAFLMSFFINFVFMATMQILIIRAEVTRLQCTILTFFIYFGLNSGFFWLNIMCYDIWKKFRKISVNSSSTFTNERTKFLCYCVYACGFPLALTVLLAALEFSNLEYHKLLPNLRRGTCFIRGTSKLIYLYTPMLIICVLNIILIMLVVIKIVKIKKQTQRLQKKDTQRLWVFIKLFILSGFSWILEAVSEEFPEYEYWWRYTDAYNVLFGVIIFKLFVCKKKIYEDLKKRFLGEASVRSISTQKTGSSLTSLQDQNDNRTKNPPEISSNWV